jgi:Arc/MetJ family transcription regulator
VTVALDPVKSAYAPGTYRIRCPIEVEKHPAAHRVFTRFVDEVLPLLDTMDRHTEVPIDDSAPAYTMEFTSLPWQRRRVGAMVAELVQWLDAWADTALVGGRMALRARLGEADTIHLNQELPF